MNVSLRSFAKRPIGVLIAVAIFGSWVLSPSSSVGQMTAPVAGESDPAPAPPGFAVQPATFVAPANAMPVSSVVPAAYVPRHVRMASGASVMAEPMVVSSGEPIIMSPTPMQGEVIVEQGGMIGGHFQKGAVVVDDMGCDVGCDPCPVDCGTCEPGYFMLPLPCLTLEHFTIFSGVHGFTGPSNLSGDLDGASSFGFHYGFNWGMPFLPSLGSGLGLQVGLAGSNSDFSHPNNTRNQMFATAGIYRRVDWGLQFGFVLDYMRDTWYFDSSRIELGNVRGSIGWKWPCTHEVGFWFTSSTSNSQTVNTGLAAPIPPSYTITPTDLYAFYYKRRFDECGGTEARLMLGGTSNNDGLLAIDVHTPINHTWALEGSFTYIIPQEEFDPVLNQPNEGWNVSINVVWYPWRTSGRAFKGCYPPLMKVADKGTFFMSVAP